MSEQLESRQTILLELDAVLDTRLGTIARISEDLAEKTLNGGYHSRDTDVFELVDMEHYKTLYAQRDSVTLSKSMCSGVLRIVKQLVAALTEQAISRPYHTGPRIVVNLHPYSETLSGDEKDAIQQAIAAWVKDPSTEVELLSFTTESLTPELVRANNIAAMFMYQYEDWMNAHTKAFEKTRLADVTLFSPAIFSTKPTEEEMAKIIREGAHPLLAMEMLASPLIHLQLIPVSHFSILANRK